MIDPNHDIVPTLRMFNGVMTGIAADEIERLRARVKELEAAPIQQAGVDACGRCDGSGESMVLIGVGPDAHDALRPCPDCKGTGDATPAAQGDERAILDDLSKWAHTKECATDGAISVFWGEIHPFVARARAALARQQGGGDAELNDKALIIAKEIALLWGRDRSQFVSRIQVPVIEAMLWAREHGTGDSDAERLRAMACEWDRARRGVDSRMPIWDALCEAIGDNADGNGMRAAIDTARAQRAEGEQS
ncbi:zinc finger-like domain-containing protein [Achromobacter aloeverae]|uniref:Uncharacterized protein n=1 Tax=Achromobacter aloeverae TaxID=1750518 RepID=A0A4Q1HIF0_9BURK|nr:zinc finger-like domain-containing protein [Achromobacter aloeverae]RXN87978.1 hypothetical protein C7R54_15485 [Achromobacter aloeverae]